MERMTVNARAALVFAVFLLNVSILAAAEKADTPWWPQFHGPNRDNRSTETGLLKTWPEGGPKLIWKFSECGGGFSMVSIADGRIYTAGDFGDDEYVLALDMDGKLLWKTKNGKAWPGPYPGSRTTPTYDNGVLYHMSPTGRLAALEAATGKQIWAVDLKERFGRRYGTWAMAENILIDGEKLFCLPGGTEALVAALDKKTGKTIWINNDFNDVAAYCSPIIVDYKGVRQLITVSQKTVLCLDVETGKLLWSHPHVTKHDQNVNRPLFKDGHVFVVSGHLGGCVLLKINPDLKGVTEVWANKRLDNCHGGVILVDGYLYGSSCRSGGKAFFCADFLTGEPAQIDRSLRKMSLTYADGRLYGITALSPPTTHHPPPIMQMGSVSFGLIKCVKC